MLKIIEPSSHKDYQSEIDTLLYLFQVSQKVELPLEEKVKSTFIIAKDAKCGVYGGSILRKRPLYALDERIEAVLSTLHSKSRKVWFVQLCACMVECEKLSREDKIKLFKSFYSSLYKKLIIFGKKKKTHFLVLSLSPSDCVITSTYQGWPYILEVLPSDTLDNLFQGILALKPALKPEKRTDDKRAKSSPFLMGEGARRWRVTFDWILSEGNLLKVLEGNFDRPEAAQFQHQEPPYTGNFTPNNRSDEPASILASIEDPVWKNWCAQLLGMNPATGGLLMNGGVPVKAVLLSSDVKQIAKARFKEFDGRLVLIECATHHVQNRIEDLRLKFLAVVQATYPNARSIRTQLNPHSFQQSTPFEGDMNDVE